MKTKLIESARQYAFDKHDNPAEAQRYGHAPYSKHLEDTLKNAEKYIYYITEDKREVVFCSCWAHDTIEDTNTNPADLERLFNSEIADVVLRVSNERGWDRKEKNFKTYPKIWANDLAIFVKLCDRISNTINSKETKHRMYGIYKNEYPVFRYALKVRDLYSDMWKELDELNDYYGVS